MLKPQREGGGNNFCKKEMVARLTNMSREELSAYILMERIIPKPLMATMIRLGRAVQCNTICELGVFGLVLRVENGELLMNEYGGYLLRVKPIEADEGGVAAG